MIVCCAHSGMLRIVLPILKLRNDVLKAIGGCIESRALAPDVDAGFDLMWEDRRSLLQEEVDLTGPETGSLKVLRGGAWYYGPDGVRSAHRAEKTPDVRYDGLGFRCVSVATSSQ